MCTVLLPPGGNPIAVNKYIISYHIIKFCCFFFFCELDSRAKVKHYKMQDWSMRENSVPGEMCVRNRPLFDKEKILLPPPYSKLGLMKNFVKVTNKHVKGFEYLRENSVTLN
jgi:hypothetical protein